MTLLPGDIISTGTPAGVGLGFNPPVYLKAGDLMELGIDGLGTSSKNVWLMQKLMHTSISGNLIRFVIVGSTKIWQ